jgi:predicted  nucleic acid-binding Zn-ribbon protein
LKVEKQKREAELMIANQDLARAAEEKKKVDKDITDLNRKVKDLETKLTTAANSAAFFE